MNILLDSFEKIFKIGYFWTDFLGFQQTSIQLSEIRHDAWMLSYALLQTTLGLWQLTPTKQESRPEIQDVR